MSVRERFELAQAAVARTEPVQEAREPSEAVRVLERDCSQLEAAVRALRHEAEEHLAQHRRWDEVRHGRPLHPWAWPISMLVGVALGWLLPSRVAPELLLTITSVLGSVEAVRWLHGATRSRVLLEEGGGRPDDATLDVEPRSARPRDDGVGVGMPVE